MFDELSEGRGKKSASFEKRGEDEPGYADSERVLHRDEVGEDPQRRRRRDDHDQQPEIQLRFRPVVSPPHHSDLGRHFFFCGERPWMRAVQGGGKGEERGASMDFIACVLLLLCAEDVCVRVGGP